MKKIKIKVCLDYNYINVAEGIRNKIEDIAFDNVDFIEEAYSHIMSNSIEVNVISNSRYVDLGKLSRAVSDYLKSNLVTKKLYKGMDISME